MARFGSMIALVGCFAGASAGCSSSRQPEPAKQGAESVASAQAVLVGYTHGLSASRFKIGQNVGLELSTPQIQRWRGSLGAFALDPSNGATCASLDATSPTGPYELDEATHAANVKAYFVRAGLPADQIGEIVATYRTARMGGAVTEAAPPPVLESITSIIRRRVSGVLVAESEAWAKMTTAGEVDMECVFWPPISMSVVNAAVAFQNAMNSSSAHSAYLSKLPGPVHRETGVVIHHSDMSIHGPATAYVSYDVVLDGASDAAPRHFDQNGTEFRLPHESSPAAQVTRSGR